jgi:hypothetical protein
VTSKPFEVTGRACLDWEKQALQGILSRVVLYKCSFFLCLGPAKVGKEMEES